LHNSSWLTSMTCLQSKRPCRTCSPAECTGTLREGTGQERANGRPRCSIQAASSNTRKVHVPTPLSSVL
jgi:hypothetical protein